MKIQHRTPVPAEQRGVATLYVALALLAILTVVTIFAANVGFFEQRTSANEYRQKLAFQAAEAGLNQSIEFLKVNSARIVSTGTGGWLFPGAARWQSCSTALPAGMTYDPCLAASPSMRPKLYRYVGSTSGVLPLSEALPAGVSQTFTSTGGAQAMGAGGFTTSYHAYATLCRLDVSAAVPQCSLSPSNEGTFYVTVVSRGAISGENATAAVKESFGTFRLIGRTPDAPLIAAGTSVALGSAEIVPNPNGAGFGVPVSIWAKGNASVAAADFMTCQLGEWLTSVRTGGTAPPQEDLLNGVCLSCTCGGLRRGFGFLSGKYVEPGGGGATRIEALDILDVEGATPDVNVDRALDSKYFPDDLFLYVFGVPKANAETYLTANATPLTSTCNLTANDSGLYWYTGTADCTISNAGSLAAPVVLVSDRKVVLNANSTFFGIIFVRDKYVATGELLKASGTPQVYGSVILEGSATINGSPGIIFNKAVLQNVFNSPKFIRYGAIPGSWSDTVN